MSGRCCTGECRQGRDCHERRGLRIDRLVLLGLLVAFWTVALTAVVLGCAS